jgi:hypothetical protein
MLKKFLVGGCIVLFRNHPSSQGVLTLGIILVFVRPSKPCLIRPDKSRRTHRGSAGWIADSPDRLA